MILQTTVLAYQVLNNENISFEKKQLLRATYITLSHENMTNQLKALHDSSGNSVNNNDNFDVKCEPE